MVAHAKLEGGRLVVFGAGYVGGEVVRQGIKNGLRVVALTRNAERARELRAVGAEVVVGELASDAWHEEIGGASAGDFVVNCVSAGGGGVEGYRRSYVEGMRSVVAWLGKGKNVKGFVYTSSTSVYPQSDGVVVRECDGTDGNDDERARILLESERLALGGGACVLRLAGIYGPGRHLLLDQVREGADEISGRGDYRLNLIHRDDAAGAIWAVLGAGTEMRKIRGEIFNVCDDGAASRAEVVAWIARRLGVAMPRFSGVAAVGRKSALLDRVISNEKIKTRTMWRPRFASFREGYEAVVAGMGK